MQVSKKSHIIFLITGLLITSYLILSIIQQKTTSYSIIQKKFETKFLEQKTNLNNSFNKIYEKLTNDNANRLLFDYDVKPQVYISFIIFKNNMVSSWSSNRVMTYPLKYNADTFFVAQLDNGYYQVQQRSKGDLILIGLNLIKYNFPFPNDHLSNKFNPAYELPKKLSIQINGKTDAVKIPSIINYNPSSKPDDNNAIFFFIVFLVAYIFTLLSIYRLYQSITILNQKKLLFLIFYSLDVIIIRLLIYFFHIPGNLQETSFFNPTYFASIIFFDSLGDLMLNAISIFAICLAVFIHFPISDQKSKSLSYHYFKTFSIFFHFFIFFKLLEAFIKILIFDSNYSLDLSNIFSLSLPGYFSFFALFLLILSYTLIGIRLFETTFREFRAKTLPFFVSLGSAFFLSLFFVLLRSQNIAIPLVPLLFILLLLLQKLYYKNLFNNFSILLLLFFFSFVAAFLIFHYNSIKEKQNRKLFAYKISNTSDPIAEYQFSQFQKEINNDDFIQQNISNALTDDYYLDSIIFYLNEKYFSRIFRGYSSTHTICTDDQLLLIQPEEILTNCNDYFENQIHSFCDSTLSSHLFRYNLSEAFRYIAKFHFYPIVNDDSMRITVFSEFYYKTLPEEGLGYPDLLVDQSIDLIPDLSSYSYARYHNGELFYKFGNFNYFLQSDTSFNEPFFTNSQGYNHYFYPINDNNHIIISKARSGILNLLAPFAYLFISFTIILLILLFIFFHSPLIQSISLNFSNRLQIIIISIIIVIFLFEGLLAIFYIRKINSDKNNEILKEKTHSVLIELEHKLSNENVLDISMQEYLSNLLNKFSMVFFSDINLYNLSGQLLATSRPPIFEEGLTSTLMNPVAFNKLNFEKQLLFIHQEKIGEHFYLSAYIPFRNANGEISAYLNLPYFAKQSELREEIASFLSTFLNIYILFIVLSVVLSFIISRYTTQPLKILQNKLSQLTLLRSNEKISWKSRDEIGKLVDEYNRKVDELESSALLLAQSERESAWREMAKQIAHEIKNPLTPMKLSVQALQKSWNEKSPDFSFRIKRFTKTIIDQIEELSRIATEFSDFAKMPQPKVETFDLSEPIESVIDLYKDSENINISFQYDKSRTYPFIGDKKLIFRAFSNIIKNSVQALDNNSSGKIRIILDKTPDHYEIQFSDNGPGIPLEISDKIFSPNFTTKSGGMGLGLAMVKNIIQSYSGTISYSSFEGKGTTFILCLPLKKS